MRSDRKKTAEERTKAVNRLGREEEDRSMRQTRSRYRRRERTMKWTKAIAIVVPLDNNTQQNIAADPT